MTPAIHISQNHQNAKDFIKYKGGVAEYANIYGIEKHQYGWGYKY